MLRRSPEKNRAREGGVLPLVLVLLLALELLAHGALLMALQEEAASRAAAGVLQARVAAGAALRTAAAPVGRPYIDTSLWSVWEGPADAVGAGHFQVRARRLGREGWWWVAEGGVRGHPWKAETAMPAWLPDPAARLQAFGGVVVAGATATVRGSERIETSGVRRDAAPLDPAPCQPWLAVLDSIFLGRETPALARVSMDPAQEPSLGRLDRARLLDWIPAAVETGGVPPAGPPVVPRAVQGDLVLDHRHEAGLLVVEGSVEMRGGSYDGVVLAGGGLTLRDGASLVGFARVAGDVDIGPDSRVVGSGCRALLALAGDLSAWVRFLPLTGTSFAPF